MSKWKITRVQKNADETRFRYESDCDFYIESRKNFIHLNDGSLSKFFHILYYVKFGNHDVKAFLTLKAAKKYAESL